MSGEDGILEVEVTVGLRPYIPTYLFGPDFPQTGGWVGPTQSIGWSCIALAIARRLRLRVKRVRTVVREQDLFRVYFILILGVLLLLENRSADIPTWASMVVGD